MTMTEATSPFAAGKNQSPASSTSMARWSERWQRIEAALDRLGDRLNPILVKEARQAMKSRQFVVTFSMLLAFGWLYTLAFIAFTMPGIYFAPLGSAMLIGYYLLLTIPLLIVVPYAAFRSLSSEREDGTFELLSITALSARQIVTGKLGSAMLQMLVYYSALAPCIAFTYLLRGIDVVTIGLFLVYTFLASLMLSIIGLMLATVTRSRHWQVVLSVIYVMALLGFAIFWNIIMLSALANSATLPYDEPEWWVVNLAILTFYVSFAALFLLIAAGQLTFASENRSTKLRVVLLVQQALVIGWFSFMWLAAPRDDGAIVAVEMALLGILWAIAGAFLTGESAELSPRAKRQLPQSLLGRMAFTWFNPGAGTGYVFATVNLLGGILLACLAFFWREYHEATSEWYPIWWGLAIFGYVAGFLGFTRLLVFLARRRIAVSLMAVFICHGCAAIVAVAVPLIVQGFISWGDMTTFQYTPLQLSNWMWTLTEIVDEKVGGEVAIPIFLLGLAMFFLNLIVAAREAEQVRLTAPERVLADDATLHPEPSKPAASPWDKA